MAGSETHEKYCDDTPVEPEDFDREAFHFADYRTYILRFQSVATSVYAGISWSA